MDTSNSGYKLLELIALSGEFSPVLVSRLGISPSYSEKLITRLKEQKYIKTHYKDRLRGYRLTSSGKKLLLVRNPDRFLFYLSGCSETNQPRSSLPRRQRLHYASHVYVLLRNADITFFRDRKPLLFRESDAPSHTLPLPVFYHSREIKELGAQTIQINNSRAIGILLSPACIYVVFYTGDGLMKWEYRTELRLKALLSYHISQGILSKEQINNGYSPNVPIKALIIGRNMDTSLKLLTSTGGFRKSYFYLDTSFDYFHYLPDTYEGEVLLKLLCNPQISTVLRQLLLSDLQPPSAEIGLEHDAFLEGRPVLLAFDFDMQRITHFRTALSFRQLFGNLICFDFQRNVMQQYFGELASVTTINLEKLKRRLHL
ncbi:hypothetical protein [Eisenbergiella tayi]|uniref:hypothetical protein n=1 Tax=Eisenbergiella tayi TaxID=1432052 RepID=UPI001FA6F5D4|nr:hypothetical protein [Eisenbergiella tayi]